MENIKINRPKFKKKKVSFYGYIKNIINDNKLIILLFFFIIILIIEKNIYLRSCINNKIMSLIIPTVPSDFNRMINNYKFYKKFIIGINDLVFIGNEELEKLLKVNKYFFEIPITFINEKTIIDVDKIKKLIENKNKNATQRSGWYIQQFLKMNYCQICKEKYYLIWDSDTIPIKKVNMFSDDGTPYFNVKTEFHPPYFKTMNKLIPELSKKNNYSFISEHMLINTKIMKNLIKRIENNFNITGKYWFEKIINSIDVKDILDSGFSEYETYGTFVNEFYKNSYKIRSWKSLRNGKNFYNQKLFTYRKAKICSRDYDAISFENY